MNLGLIFGREVCGVTAKKFTLNCDVEKAKALLAEHFEVDSVKGIPATVTADGTNAVVELRTKPLVAERYRQAVQAFEQVFGP